MTYLHWHALSREWRGYIWLAKCETHGQVKRCTVPACIAVLPNGGLH